MVMADLDRMMAQAEQGQELPTDPDEESLALPIQAVQLNAASRIVTIYHRETGEPRKMSLKQAEDALKKRHKLVGNPLDGTFIFSPAPTKQFHWGDTKCALHPDNPDRAEYDKWGLPTCTSEHLASPGEVIRHMRMRHPSADAVIREHRQEREKALDREAQTASTDALKEAITTMTSAFGQVGLPVPPEVLATVETHLTDVGDDPALPDNTTDVGGSSTSEAITTALTVVQWECPKCHEMLTAETEQKMIGKRSGHTRSQHPKRRQQAR